MGGAIGIVAGGAITHRILTHSWRAVAGFHMPVLFPGVALGIGLLAAVASGALAGHLAYRGFGRTDLARSRSLLSHPSYGRVGS